jgi:hypothetical protein
MVACKFIIHKHFMSASIKTRKSLPEKFIKEYIDGKPIYYKGALSIINDTQNLEDIMGSSSLQALIIGYIHALLWVGLKRKKYWVLSNEIGAVLSKKNRFSFDVAIFEKAKLPASSINAKYVAVAPKIAIEIDTQIELLDDTTSDLYVQRKTQLLLDNGVEKVIWVFTPTKKIMVAESNKDWVLFDWKKSVTVIEDISFCIADFLAEEEVE